ncbi:hypothetical protein I4U23_014291 [Adineta vaga]|nr:hypothetical protein I4U23_014291 [Adineta vaga]
MFKNLKEKLATQVNKTNQTLFSTILPTDSTSSSSNDVSNRTSSFTSHDEHHENNRSRIDSASSDISQTQLGNTNYVSPSRQYVPPSDIESEYGADESDHETNTKMQKLLNIYKNKFTQLKNAYSEVEREKENLKNVLQQQQDTHIKRQTELRQKMKQELQMKEQTESIYLNEIKSRDKTIEDMTQQFIERNKSFQELEEEVKNLREKNTQREKFLLQCKEKIKIHQDKQTDLVTERDNLREQLDEKEALLQSLNKNEQSEQPYENERLQEQLKSTKLRIQQLEVDLELAKQQTTQSDSNEDIQQKYNDLLNKFHETSMNNEQFQASILKDKVHLEELNCEIEILKTNHENLTNELHHMKQTKDDIQLLLDQTNQERTMYKDKYEQIQHNERPDDTNVILTKLQQDYEESVANRTELTEKHLEEITKLRNEHEIELNKKIEELQEEHQRIQLEKDDEYQKAIDKLKEKLDKIRKEQLFELKATAKKVQDESSDLSTQINEQQKEINRLHESINEQNKKLNQYEHELEEKTSHITELERTIASTTELTTLQEELQEKKLHISNIEQQLADKLIQFKVAIEEHERLQEQKDREIDTLKQTLSNQESLYHSLTNEHQQTIEERNKYKSLVDEVHQQLTSQKSQLDEREKKFDCILSEKTDLENELDRIRIQFQSTQLALNEKTNNDSDELRHAEERIQKLQIQYELREKEIETLKSEIASLVNTNEENIRRIDEFDNEKFNFEQEIIEKDRQISEMNEQNEELELNLKQAQESGVKLRKALQKMRDSMTNKEQTTQDAENQLQKTIDQYEKQLRIQEKEHDSKLKVMAKEMNRQIEEREETYQQQINDLNRKIYQTNDDVTVKSEQRVANAEERALVAEREVSKMQEQLKEKQLDYYRVLQDLQIQIQNFKKEAPQMIEDSTQTIVEEEPNHDIHSFLSEPTEVDYLKQIVLAYMTGTDRLTMAKVICAVLRYTDDEKSLILENEKLRHSRWLNSVKS